MGQRVNYFNDDEFACPCCGADDMSAAFVEKLNDARRIAGVPFVINSGFRCEFHNASDDVQGSKTSSHLYGVAADIRVTSSAHRFKILRALLAVGFTRIGVAKTFIHVDSDNDKPQEVVWTYG